MTRARLSPRAAQDLQAIRDASAADDPDAAERVHLTILDTADFPATNPAIGRRILNAKPRHKSIRWMVVPKYRNYLFFYRPFQDSVMVVRILHAAEDWTRFFPASSKP